MASSSASSCPGVRWNIISTDGAPNVQLPSLRMLMAGRDMREAGDALMQQGEKRNDVYRARTAVQKFLEELWEDDDDEE